MASGRKNYFRHLVTARSDEKIVALITKHGKEAYFHYMALVEMCAQKAINEDLEGDETFVFHKRTVCNELMVTPQRLSGHLLAIQSSLLGDLVVTGEQVEIKFPNLRKYLGRYDGKSRSNSPNKRKEKEIKENNIQMRDQAFIESLKNEQAEEDAKKNLPNVQAIDFRNPKDFKFAGIKNPDELIQYWNSDFVLKGYPASPLTLGGGYQQNFFLINSRLLKEGKTWRDYLARVDRSSFLTVLKKGGKPSITWLLVEKNFDEIMSGKYDDAPEKEDPLDVFMAEFAPKREQA